MDNAVEEDWVDAKGRKVRARLVSDADKLRDQTIDKIMGNAEELSAQIARFKRYIFEDVQALADVLRGECDAKVGGQKGSVEIISFDGCRKLQIMSFPLKTGPLQWALKGDIEWRGNDIQTKTF